MANEVNTGLSVDMAAAEAIEALAAREFDPGELLALPPRAAALPLAGEGVEDLPYATGPAAEVVRTFDPAANLGDAARRGPAMIGDGKPLVARIGGVEVVTIPLEHYAALLSPLALARPGVAGGSGTPDAEGMLLFLLSLHADGAVSLDQLAKATGLEGADLGSRIAAYMDAKPKPWVIDSMDPDGTMWGKTHEGVPFSLGPAIDPAASPVDLTPSPKEATIDLVPAPVEVPLTVGDVAASYGAAVQSGEERGGAMDRTGQPAEPAGKGIAAIDAERGGAKRSRR